MRYVILRRPCELLKYEERIRNYVPNLQYLVLFINEPLSLSSSQKLTTSSLNFLISEFTRIFGVDQKGELRLEL